MGMTTLGWIFLACGWGCITALSVYCFTRVLTIESRKGKDAEPKQG